MFVVQSSESRLVVSLQLLHYLHHIFPIFLRFWFGLLDEDSLQAELITHGAIVSLDELDRELEKDIHKTVEFLLSVSIVNEYEGTYRRMTKSQLILSAFHRE